MSRVVRCTIEMELMEGIDFNFLKQNLSDKSCELEAREKFFSLIADEIELGDIFEFVQTKIVEEAS